MWITGLEATVQRPDPILLRQNGGNIRHEHWMSSHFTTALELHSEHFGVPLSEKKASGVVLGVAWLHENWLGGQWTMTNIFYYNVESPAMCSMNMLCFGSTSLFDTSQFCFLKMIGLKWKPVWFENKYLKDKKPEKESIRCANCVQKPHARCILYAENQFNDNVIEKNVMQFYCISYLKALASVFIVISGYICIVLGCSKISFYSFVHF